MICGNPECSKVVVPRAPGTGGRARKYCSRQCGIDAGNRRRHARDAAALKAELAAMSPRVCAYRNCEESFEVTRRDRIFCGDICGASENGYVRAEANGHWWKRKPEQYGRTNAKKAAKLRAARCDLPTVFCSNPDCDSGEFCPTFNRGAMDRFCSERCAARQASNDWATRNPEAMRHAAGRRRAMIRGNGGSPPGYRGFPVYAEQSWWLAHGVEMDVDHWLPISKGGRHSPENLTLLLAVDNAEKWSKLPYVEWTPPAYYTDLPN